MNGGLNSISGSMLPNRFWMFSPFLGGKTSKENSVLPSAWIRWSVTFI
ncbi:hypothetical protein SAMN00120144_3875 [Hymenobacter roseosalivarius DSM 11622]|uniref:Uncharacterized protein n=1 Tax=Hymenobacter roseosalivarius DSM 11622 TaxID=645990 RepID=A0A1W1UV51_9BACT|nr:hypothetical protein SAMN00120144_3875 [Hymenobacter roseosalivarius DSM 11622]